jgi:hypothetical protein
VIRQIAREGFQTMSELRKNVLGNFSRKYPWRFMKTLVNEGLLVECSADSGGILGWSVSRETQKRLSLEPSEEWQREIQPMQYKSSFSHDIVVREVKQILCMSPLVSNWIPEQAIRKKLLGKIHPMRESEKRIRLFRLPDAEFNVDISGRRYRAALEVELTRKSKRRIFEKLETQITAPDLDFVFYLASDESHLRLLWSIYQEVLTNSTRVRLKTSQNGILFSTLETLREKKLQTNFIGSKQSFSFESFRTNTA